MACRLGLCLDAAMNFLVAAVEGIHLIRRSRVMGHDLSRVPHEAGAPCNEPPFILQIVTILSKIAVSILLGPDRGCQLW